MWKQVARILLPVIPTAVTVFLWVDSQCAVRRLPFLPGGDAALGFKSAAGWLSWGEFTPWDPVNSEAMWIYVPYWVLVSVGLAFVWCAFVRQRENPRFRSWEWVALGGVVLLLASLPGRPDPVNHLRRALSDPHDEYALHEAYEAVDEVNRAGRGGDAATLLSRLLADNDRSVRRSAALSLARLHADPKLIVSALTGAYADKDLRDTITFALGEIGPVDDRVIPALIVALRDENPRVRGAAASAFLKIGPAAEAAVPALVEALDDKPLRLDVLRALELMGPRAKQAAPALVVMSKTETGYDRLWAAEALWKIDPNVDVVVPALIESLKDPFLPIRVDAAGALGDIGPRARAAIPALIAARDYKPKPAPRHAARAPGPGDASIPAPEEMSDEEFYPRVRNAAVGALLKIEGRK